MNGRKSDRLSPPLYKSSGGLLDVATQTIPILIN